MLCDLHLSENAFTDKSCGFLFVPQLKFSHLKMFPGYHGNCQVSCSLTEKEKETTTIRT